MEIKYIIEKSFCLLLMFFASNMSHAQDIRITHFERNLTNLEGKVSPKIDRNGEECALIRFHVRDTKYEIQGSLGIVETIKETGFIKIYVPHGTKKITVRHKGMFPLVDYVIPIKIEKEATYDAKIEVEKSDDPIWNIETKRKSFIYISAGFNAMSIMGPSGSIGIDLNRHVLEYTFVYGLNKSDALTFYDSKGALQTVREYNTLRSQLRYGYDFNINDFVTITPLVGGCYNLLKGNAVGDTTADNPYKKQGWSLSATVSMRISASLGKIIKMYVTPEYDFAVHKSELCTVFNERDDKIKSWTQGFNLCLGLMVCL